MICQQNLKNLPAIRHLMNSMIWSTCRVPRRQLYGAVTQSATQKDLVKSTWGYVTSGVYHRTHTSGNKWLHIGVFKESSVSSLPGCTDGADGVSPLCRHRDARPVPGQACLHEQHSAAILKIQLENFPQWTLYKSKGEEGQKALACSSVVSSTFLLL